MFPQVKCGSTQFRTHPSFTSASTRTSTISKKTTPKRFPEHDFCKDSATSSSTVSYAIETGLSTPVRSLSTRPPRNVSPPRPDLYRLKTLRAPQVKYKMMTHLLEDQTEKLSERAQKKTLAKALKRRYGVKISRIEVEKFAESELLLLAKAKWRKILARKYATRILTWFAARKVSKTETATREIQSEQQDIHTIENPKTIQSEDLRTVATVTIQRMYRGHVARLKYCKRQCFRNIDRLRCMFMREKQLLKEEEMHKLVETWANKIAKGCKEKEVIPKLFVEKKPIACSESCENSSKPIKGEDGQSLSYVNLPKTKSVRTSQYPPTKPAKKSGHFLGSKPRYPSSDRSRSVSTLKTRSKDICCPPAKPINPVQMESFLVTSNPLCPSCWPMLVDKRWKAVQDAAQATSPVV